MSRTNGPTQKLALLRFGGDLLLPTAIYRTTESFNSQSPDPSDFVLASSEKAETASNYYRHFKADLSLTKAQAETPDEEVWSMRTKTGDYTRLNEIVGQSSSGKKEYFNPHQAAAIFLSKVCKRAVERARDLFGNEKSLQIHFTAPNYEYEGDGTRGKKKSRRYRENIRRIVDSVIQENEYENVSFQVGGTDFLYEPYGVYYYYSLLEHGVEPGETQAGETFLVFDMGGSTTDVAVVQVNRQESDFRLYPICTSIGCAGAYFDQYVLKKLLGRDRVPRRSKKWMPYLERIEEAKIAICTGRREAVQIEIDEEEEGTFQIDEALLGRVLREIWQDENQPLGPGFRGFLGRVQRLAREHGQLLEFEKIENIFLAGGSTGLPGLEDLIRMDLDRLDLLGNDGEANACVRPRRRLAAEKGVPNSSLAVLGQVSSIAEEERERILEEGEEIYALVRTPDGTPYSFERTESERGEPQREEEFLLCAVDELEERDTVRLEPGGYDRFEDLTLTPGQPSLQEAEVYLRADVNDYGDEPDRRFQQRNEDEAPPDDERKKLIRFTAHAELRPDRLRVKPFLWNVQPHRDYRRTLDAEEDGYVSVSLRPDLQDEEAAHICIDLGMNNTAVALYAPGHDLPCRPDLEVFSLHSRRVAPSEALQKHLPDAPMNCEEAVEGVLRAHRDIGYRPAMSGLFRILRGAHMYAFQQEEGKDDVVGAFAEALRAHAGEPVPASATLRRELDVVRDRIERSEDGIAEFQQELHAALEEEGNASFEEIEARTHADEGESASADEAADDDTTFSTEDHDQAVDETSTTSSDDRSGTGESSGLPTEAHEDGHWAVGMTQWMQQMVQDTVAPIRKSNDAMRKAVEQMSERIERIEEDGSENGGDLADAVREIRETLNPLVASLQSKEDGAFSDDELKKQIEQKVEERTEHPLSHLATGELDTSLSAFRNFVEERGFIYPEKVLRRAWMHCAGKASGLVVLAGPPGCGKTSLVRLLAEFFNRDLGEDGWEHFHLLEPVSPSWFSPDSLLGSESAITGEYKYTSFLKFLIKAESQYFKALAGPGTEHARLFLACLDEFNIAQPEQYLANILSKMEAPEGSPNRRLHLGQDTSGESAFEVDLTANLKLFATINTDATTKTLSPKVLDRATYIPVSPENDSLRRAAKQFKDEFGVPAAFHDAFLDILDELSQLARAGQAPLAYRSIEQAYQYASQHPDVSKETSTVMGDVLVSFFLSKLPGAYAINDPEGRYRKRLQKSDKLREYDEVDRLLRRVQQGLPGQAAL
ncbi:MAG: Hsp70 family protein [Salinibacter sp.]